MQSRLYKRSVTVLQGWTALMSASWKGHLEVVKVLIRAGAEVNASDPLVSFNNGTAAQALNSPQDATSF